MTTITAEPPVPDGSPAAPPRSRLRRLLTGPVDQPTWARPALLVLLAGTAVLYLWNLTANGYGNMYYATATQAATQSWQAWLFGSLDAGNAITVDKPPAALWLSGLFARIFGFSSWSVLAPQAFAGVAAVGVLYATVRRTSGPAAGLLAGAGLALTPVAVSMFRYNNPDALLTLLLVLGAYCVVRALEKGSPRWLMLAGTAVGFAFLTKMLQAFLVLPAFALVYLIAAPIGIGRRLAHVAAAAGAVVVSTGWYIALVELWPASSRPYIGGSTTNSLWELTFGYNGLGRIFGGDGNPSGTAMGGPPGGGGNMVNVGFGGETGITRMFDQAFGGEISWLLPAALVALAAGLWITRRAPRTDRTRAAVLLWGGWLLVTAVVFSFMSGITHEYYAVALAPAITALVAVVGVELWRRRATVHMRLFLAAMIGVTAVWDFVLLGRADGWLPPLRWIVLIGGLLVAATVAVGGGRRLGRLLLVPAIVAVLLGGATYGVATATRNDGGPTPTSGPSSVNAGRGPAMMLDGQRVGGAPPPGAAQGTITGPGDGPPPNGQGNGPMRRTGGPDRAETSPALVDMLRNTTTRWAAAVNGANSSGGPQIASGRPVMAIGGFSGRDDAPTLAQFQQYVADGQISYYIAGGQGGLITYGPAGTRPVGGGKGGPNGGPDGGSAGEIAEWVAANFNSSTVDGRTVYDLRAHK
ncbi:4-amino-4-deoxy-L-arabinose transferase-like glycosyltransferase [Herbihabitans rhizosphaerae]|uniref:4-amino-4-deoxy-L-arabinose transferase-like glycosyltransferase n=1 Tax=Herbihabitans rhizosphaerae TaxID=1872711 RepID=A0A4V2ES25_9PSEU|nr:glycosyltransferase family 39 protein [Herbihabitans rhizosphaerae]RZS34887.1 4-amino-4-deoxy-L-arabinose transferase-like glycosyltransferase [Herbihabitans rhizosphaerae]